MELKFDWMARATNLRYLLIVLNGIEMNITLGILNGSMTFNRTKWN